MPNQQFTKIVRFGCFRLDCRSGELYQDGQRIRLQEQPFRVLALLTHSAGELVTREEIRRSLWPNGTVVEFENAVSAVIKKLRIALGDSAEEPVYIETVKRRGYRFIAPLETESGGCDSPPVDSAIGNSTSGPLSAVPDLVGRTVSHYRVLDRIGGGGIGVVYRAEDTRLGRPVALKFLRDESSAHALALERLYIEARTASALNHPNICTIYEIGDDLGQPFIAMELLTGSTLHQRISDDSLSLANAINYACQISEGLDAAHRANILHRDLKPANIFITSDGSVKILDFGLAQAMGPGEDADPVAGFPIMVAVAIEECADGTAAYMSPEQVLGKILDARSDLFSFGAVLYEMVTGYAPFRGDTDQALFEAILHTEPLAPIRVRPQVPAPLNRIIVRCLEKNRDLRYANTSEIRSELRVLKQDPNGAEAITGTRPNPGKTRRLIAIVSLTILLIVAIVVRKLHLTPALTDKDTIVLAEFVNLTGDVVFDETLREGLAIQLEQSPFLSILSEQRVQHALRLMLKAPDTRLTPELAREVCERNGSAAVLAGSIASLGTAYVLTLRAQNCRTGDTLDAEQVQVAKKEQVLDSLSQMARRFRTRIGESLATVKKHDTTLIEATTSSLDALKAYSTGWKIHALGETTAALQLFRSAVKIDPGFAMAHASLGRMYADLDESDLSARSTRTAWELRNRASEPERFFILSSYSALVTGNLDESRQICEEWARAYPREARPHHFLSGMINKVPGHFETAIVESRKAIELDPDFAVGYYNLALNHVYLNQLEEAEKAIETAHARGLEATEFAIIRHDIAFLRGDQEGMKQFITRAQEGFQGESWILNREAFALAYSGRLRQARSLSSRAVDQAQHLRQTEGAGLRQVGAAVTEALFGNSAQARTLARAALSLTNDRDVEFAAAVTFSIAGDSASSQALANDLQRRFPEDTSVRFNYLPAVRARLALNHGEVSNALALLEPAVPYDLSPARSIFGALYPAYVRGQVLLAARKGSEAAIQFQNILNHRGIVGSEPIGALAHLQLGRAFALAGDKPSAKAAYRDFLDLWKDADADIVILRQANTEFDKL